MAYFDEYTNETLLRSIIRMELNLKRLFSFIAHHFRPITFKKTVSSIVSTASFAFIFVSVLKNFSQIKF